MENLALPVGEEDVDAVAVEGGGGVEDVGVVEEEEDRQEMLLWLTNCLRRCSKAMCLPREGSREVCFSFNFS